LSGMVGSPPELFVIEAGTDDHIEIIRKDGATGVTSSEHQTAAIPARLDPHMTSGGRRQGQRSLTIKQESQFGGRCKLPDWEQPREDEDIREDADPCTQPLCHDVAQVKRASKRRAAKGLSRLHEAADPDDKQCLRPPESQREPILSPQQDEKRQREQDAEQVAVNESRKRSPVCSLTHPANLWVLLLGLTTTTRRR